MAIDITHVQAGELITSTLVNELIDELEKIDARVTALESTGVSRAVEIDGISPQPVVVGSDLTIVGKNFDFTGGATRVKFNGIGTPQFQSLSNDSVLVCEVPEIPGLSDTGGSVLLTVANALTTASRQVDVLPLQKQQAGDADIVFVGVTPDPLAANANADFEFTLTSDAALPATMTMTPTLTDSEAVPLPWATSFLDATKNVLGSRQVTVSPGETRGFYIRVAIPSGVSGAPFDLRVDGSGGGLVSSSGSQTFVVGQTGDPDPAIANLTPSPSSVVNAQLSGSTLSVASGVFGQVSVEADFRVGAVYTVSFTPAPGLSNWTLQMLNPALADPHVTIADTDLTGVPPSKKSMLRVRARPNAGATPGQGVLTVQRDGETRKRTFAFDLVVAPAA